MFSLSGLCKLLFLFYCLLDLSCCECDVISLCVALLMDRFVLCVCELFVEIISNMFGETIRNVFGCGCYVVVECYGSV